MPQFPRSNFFKFNLPKNECLSTVAFLVSLWLINHFPYRDLMNFNYLEHNFIYKENSLLVDFESHHYNECKVNPSSRGRRRSNLNRDQSVSKVSWAKQEKIILPEIIITIQFNIVTLLFNNIFKIIKNDSIALYMLIYGIIQLIIKREKLFTLFRFSSFSTRISIKS